MGWKRLYQKGTRLLNHHPPKLPLLGGTASSNNLYMETGEPLASFILLGAHGSAFVTPLWGETRPMQHAIKTESSAADCNQG
jgi:hypothetical protein